MTGYSGMMKQLKVNGMMNKNCLRCNRRTVRGIKLCPDCFLLSELAELAVYSNLVKQIKVTSFNQSSKMRGNSNEQR